MLFFLQIELNYMWVNEPAHTSLTLFSGECFIIHSMKLDRERFYTVHFYLGTKLI